MNHERGCMSVFEKRELMKKGFLASHKKQNFLIEVENILAINENHFEDIPKNTIREISSKYKVSFPAEIKEESNAFVRRYWKGVLNDLKSTESEERQVAFLVSLLELSEKEAKIICDEEKRAIITPIINGLIANRRYSPDDEEKVKQLAKDLKVSVVFQDQQYLDKLRTLWAIENGELPILEDVDIAIPKSETVFFKDSISWLEDCQTTTRVSYRGPSARIRICKGVYYRLGSFAPKKVTTTETKLIDTGTLYLTNKRLLFVGSKSTKTIQLSKILSIEPFADAVRIVKDGGKFPILKFSTGDSEVFILLLTTLVNM